MEGGIDPDLFGIEIAVLPWLLLLMVEVGTTVLAWQLSTIHVGTCRDVWQYGMIVVWDLRTCRISH